MEHMPHVLVYYLFGVAVAQLFKYGQWARLGRRSLVGFWKFAGPNILMALVADALGFLFLLSGLLVPLLLWKLPETTPQNIRDIIAFQSVDLFAPIVGAVLDFIGGGTIELLQGWF